jgi:hypothetical protein
MPTRTKADRSAAAKKAAATRKRNQAAADTHDLKIAAKQAGDKIIEAAKATGKAAQAAAHAVVERTEAEAKQRKASARR